MSKPKIKVEMASLHERIAMAEALRGHGARLPGEGDEAYCKRRNLTWPRDRGAPDLPAFVPIAA